MRRLADTDGLGVAAGTMGAAKLFLLLGTTVVTPLAVLFVSETMEYARGLSPLDDVPAVVERDVDRDTREGASDGGLAGMEKKDWDERMTERWRPPSRPRRGVWRGSVAVRRCRRR